MQVHAKSIARVAHIADGLSSCHALAGRDIQLRHMAIKRYEVVRMFYDDELTVRPALTIEVLIAGRDYRAFLG